MTTSNPREGRGWPGYIFGGRMRTTTAALIIAFVAMWWLYETYEPVPTPQQVPASEVVPPGFIPDPNYTWAPRTDVQRQSRAIFPLRSAVATTGVPPKHAAVDPHVAPLVIHAAYNCSQAPWEGLGDVVVQPAADEVRRASSHVQRAACCTILGRAQPVAAERAVRKAQRAFGDDGPATGVCSAHAALEELARMQRCG